ncbi:PREDICTED: microsomal glutathione S-transferase 1-like [Bactrocera latifrons]|uniref:microsomal glutathione S-transferase 1-like n=1 Tax=Bactrocera latifrons TaxID=174628 RepID=UPI0008DC5F23|nr:PREDICTED: microsomal glutathione S-transferase 1-like [Bactrocera latifrons]
MAAKDLISFDNEVFSAYVFWSAVLVLKLLFMSLRTGRLRFKTRTFLNPEDLVKKGFKVGFDNPDIERVRRAHLNDLENLLPFFVIGFLYVLIDPTPALAINLFRIVGIARIVHTIVYAVVVMPQPSRLMAYLVAFNPTIYMAIQVVIAAL